MMFYVSIHALITFWTVKLQHFTKIEIVKSKSEKPIGANSYYTKLSWLKLPSIRKEVITCNI